MKLAVMALVAVLLLGGGAAGAYFYFDKPAEAAGGPVDEAKKAEHDAKVAKAKEEGGKGAPVAQFVKLDVLILPIIDETGVTQTITMAVSLEVPDEMTAKEVEHLSPRLKDAFIQDMYGTLSRKNAMKQGVLQVNMIKERLNKVSTKVLGQDKVKDVLLQVVQQRPI
jgi:flagellar FliL protein